LGFGKPPQRDFPEGEDKLPVMRAQNAFMMAHKCSGQTTTAIRNSESDLELG